MKLTDKIIKQMTTTEYYQRRKEIQQYYKNKRMKEKQKKKQYDMKYYSKQKLAIIIQSKIDGKICQDCKDFKKWDQFNSKKSRDDGKNEICKPCLALRSKVRLYTDSQFKLISNLRKRIYNALKGKTKSDTTKNLVGCSLEDLKKHLQSQFTSGMNWENYGKWHVDHILPCASFDMSKPEQQRKCFHYTNLQPLWKIDNLKKSNKVLKSE